MTEAQISYMVNRFLMWRLPEHFRPDAGISFKPDYNENSPFPMKHEPFGTNLFSADQAREMVRHMLEGLPAEDDGEPLTDVQRSIRDGTFGVRSARAAYRAAIDKAFHMTDREIDKACAVLNR